MNKGLMKYMLKDVVFLTLLGAVLEGLCARFAGTTLNAAPTVCMSFLVVFVLVARWNCWGLISTPILALATCIGGSYGDFVRFNTLYKFEGTGVPLYFSIVIGLCTVGLNVILFKKFSTKKCFDSFIKMLGFVFVDYILYIGVQVGVYAVLVYLFQCNQFVEITDSASVTTTINYVAQFGFNGYLYNLFGLAVCIIGSLILRSQGIVNNAVDKLIADKKEEHFIKVDTEKFFVRETDTVSNEKAESTEDSSQSESSNNDESLKK